MNKKLFVILAIILTGVLLMIMMNRQDTALQPVAEGLKAPPFALLDVVSGRRVSSADFKGKVVFLNFWASWCPPCKDEMPSLEALFRELSRNENFQMLTILYKDDPANAVAYLKANGYTFPVLIDHNGESARNFGVTGVPETYVIDKGGVLRKKVIGPADWNSAEAKDVLRSLL